MAGALDFGIYLDTHNTLEAARTVPFYHCKCGERGKKKKKPWSSIYSQRISCSCLSRFRWEWESWVGKKAKRQRKWFFLRRRSPCALFSRFLCFPSPRSPSKRRNFASFFGYVTLSEVKIDSCGAAFFHWKKTSLKEIFPPQRCERRKEKKFPEGDWSDGGNIIIEVKLARNFFPRDRMIHEMSGLTRTTTLDGSEWNGEFEVRF